MSTYDRHIPVLLNESIQHLLIANNEHVQSQKFLDATFGRGGHSKVILEKISETSQLFVCDRDLIAIETAKSFQDPRLTALHMNYSQVFRSIDEPLDGIIADFGLCSAQLDDPKRGFSFRAEGPLDMRMDSTQRQTALDLIKSHNAKTLANIIYKYGEERRSRPIATEIYNQLHKGQLKTTLDLANCAIKFYPKGSDKHPATRLFQAIRIATNCEFEHIEQFIYSAGEQLKTHGRLLIITFHSLEYSTVKHCFQKINERYRHNQCNWAFKKVVHPLFPTDDEKKINPRSRSARLHVFEKIEQNL